MDYILFHNDNGTVILTYWYCYLLHCC